MRMYVNVKQNGKHAWKTNDGDISCMAYNSRKKSMKISSIVWAWKGSARSS